MIVDSGLDPQDTLARTMWGEARNQSQDGLQAIANVVMNRVNHPTWWGNDVVSVCTKPYQFSCWLIGDPNRSKLMAVTQDDPIFAQCYRIAGNAITGNLPDLTNCSDSYYAKSLAHPPNWAEGLNPTIVIGDHIFFKTV